MRKVLFAAALIGGLGAAGSAIAAVGQCYDRFGRPVGPAYDTDHPNNAFINSVMARGGSCTGVVSNPYYGRRGYDYYQNPYGYYRNPYGYGYWQNPYQYNYGYRSYYPNYYQSYPTY